MGDDQVRMQRIDNAVELRAVKTGPRLPFEPERVAHSPRDAPAVRVVSGGAPSRPEFGQGQLAP